MARAHSVLVGVDGSTAGQRALDWAAGHAARTGSALHLVTAYALPTITSASLDGGYVAIDDDAMHEAATSVLADAAQRVRSVVPEVTTQVVPGDATASLVDLSREHELAVVGTRGRGGFAERLLGTVSSALPAHAWCPTVVVPTRRGEDGSGTRTGGPDAPTATRLPPRRVVVGVDGSPTARLALERAAQEARLWGAELITVAGVPLSTNGGVLAWLPAAIDRDAVLRDVRETLDAAVDELEQRHPGLAVRRVVLDGTGAELLVEFSRSVALVVVVSRGRGGFTGMLLGSTSQAVLHHAGCPVMVVTRRCEAEPEDAGGPASRA